MTTQKSKPILLMTSLLLNCFFIFGQQTASKDTTIFSIAAVEEKPHYEGRSDTFLFRFLGQNIKLPMSVRDIIGTTGTAYTYFVIDEKGQLDLSSIKFLMFKPGATKKEPKPKQITNEKLLNSTQFECVDEAKRVVGLLKKWTAAKVGGKGVKCSMTLPITFKNEGAVGR